MFPQLDGESDSTWLRRVERNPMLAQQMFSTAEFNTELKQAVHRRTMSLAGARRVGRSALVSLPKPGDARATSTIAPRYAIDARQFDYAAAAYELLLEQFDATTPPNGSIFWNGINELALAKLVDRWNTELGDEVFGQLEATTAVRYVDKQFHWDAGGVFQKYVTEASHLLGGAASGHVTAVVRCGLRHDSIFTKTELPYMLENMEDQLATKQTPTITDLTIFVIEPKHLPERPFAIFTNNEITMIPIVGPVSRWINSRGDCTVQGHVDISGRVLEYWTLRGQRPESAAATRIRTDFAKLIQWT